MKIQIGYEIVYDCAKTTPMILALHPYPNLETPDCLITIPAISQITNYIDNYGNKLSRLVLPEGETKIFSNLIVNDSGISDLENVSAGQVPVEELPDEILIYLLGSRYCETDLFYDLAWDLFGKLPAGWECVQGICDFVNKQIKFDYYEACATRTAWDAYNEKIGVCRDYAHLAIAFCRALNIPARYCTGYLSDIGEPKPHGIMDFAAWIEVYLDGGWYIFDPRNNKRRIGRIPLAKGRDAADVPISNSFGLNKLKEFKVWADEYIEN
ncbi:transglutaminase-like domain-containing protein [Francisella frigiditurris]|nr:transglutaminase family protein [Francisella frigiditurris]